MTKKILTRERRKIIPKTSTENIYSFIQRRESVLDTRLSVVCIAEGMQREGLSGRSTGLRSDRVITAMFVALSAVRGRAIETSIDCRLP